jgi:hypothetical protein
MLKNSLYIVLASFIFFMGYISESMVEAYETRENQYPPYGKEVIDDNGTKFMRDIKDETNENEEEPSEDFIALEKKYPSGCDSTSNLSEEYSCTNLFDNLDTVWQSSSNLCQEETITFTFKEPIFLEFMVFQNPESTTVLEESIIVATLSITSDNESKYFVSKELEYDNTSQWIDINSEILYDLTLKIVRNYPQNIDNQESRCAIQEVIFYGRDLNK